MKNWIKEHGKDCISEYDRFACQDIVKLEDGGDEVVKISDLNKLLETHLLIPRCTVKKEADAGEVVMKDLFSTPLYIDDDWFGIYCGKKQVFKPNFNFEEVWKKEAVAAVIAINSHDDLVKDVAYHESRASYYQDLSYKVSAQNDQMRALLKKIASGVAGGDGDEGCTVNLSANEVEQLKSFRD